MRGNCCYDDVKGVDWSRFVGDFTKKYAETDGKDGGGDGGEVVVGVLVLILAHANCTPFWKRRT